MNHLNLINEEESASKEYEFETMKYRRKTKKGETEMDSTSFCGIIIKEEINS